VLKPLISTIIVTHNSSIYIPRLFKSLKSAYDNYRNIEIIIVDNASSDDTVEKIRNISQQLGLHELTKIVQLDKNLRFANGNNIGIKIARGDIIFLLNSDTYVDENIFKAIAEAFASDTKIGVAQCLLLQYFLPWRIDSCGDFLAKPFGTAILSNYAEKLIEQPECLKIREIGHARGAAMAIRRDIINKLAKVNKGYTFPLYFLGGGYEDWYISYFAKKNGYRVVLLPSCKVYHESLSSRSFSEYTVYNQLGSFIEMGMFRFIPCTTIITLVAIFTRRKPMIIITLINILKSTKKLISRYKLVRHFSVADIRYQYLPFSQWFRWYRNYKKVINMFERKYKKHFYELLKNEKIF